MVVVAAAALLIPGGSSGVLAAAAVSAAVIATWGMGSAGRRASGSPKRWNRLHQAASASFALSLAAGALLAAGLFEGPGFFGLPRSLWGLLLGVWLIPLVVTSLGFAASFAPPDPADLERLRSRSQEGP
ncbi:MAG: hypothetical protein OXE58_07950 [Acidobacteria bacterium]|nr:hypothetical protein [Acidobacteriota bacterium]